MPRATARNIIPPNGPRSPRKSKAESYLPLLQAFQTVAEIIGICDGFINPPDDCRATGQNLWDALDLLSYLRIINHYPVPQMAVFFNKPDMNGMILVNIMSLKVIEKNHV